ncbi:MAG: glycosyltransferase, partial [Chloroflexota bacterium]
MPDFKKTDFKQTDSIPEDSTQVDLKQAGSTQPVLSLVVPIWNEEEVIPELYRRVVSVMDSTNKPWEMVCVNDGSEDRSLEMLLDLHEKDSRIKVINFSRNFGHQVAISAGQDGVVHVTCTIEARPKKSAGLGPCM